MGAPVPSPGALTHLLLYSAVMERDAQPLASRRLHWISQLERHATAIPGHPAVRFQGATTTWSQLRDRVGALGAALARRGVGFGDRVAIMTGNRPEFIEAMLAANLLGAIAVPVNFRLTGPEVAYILADCEPAVIVADAFGKGAVEAALALAGEGPGVIIAATDASGFEAYDEVLAEPGEPAPLTDVPEDAPALIMYTSGTTGQPKGAVLTHLNLQSQATTFARFSGYADEDEVTLIAAPLFHIAGIGTAAPMILTGGTVAIMPTAAFDPGHLLDLLEDEGVTSVFLVPAMWQAVCAHPSLPARDLSRLRATTWGAAPASDTLLRRMSEAFPGALNSAAFGQTEMSPVTCLLHGRDAIRKLGSVGKPIASVAARVVDADMRDVPPGEVGEIVYRGPGLMIGYWNKPEATAEAFRGGWFHSGDLVRVDDEGYIYVVDRVKDMIISGGENIYCAEVENVLAAHPDIAEVSIVGRPDPVWGETPVAYVVLTDPQASLDIEGLRTWAAAALARYKLPTALKAVPALPRNASGKVLKHTLRKDATDA